jgi:dienelactone hydrolase
VLVHEWWGITKHMHNEARKFAQQGYTAFIADMYGDAKTADNPKDAGALVELGDEGPEGDGVALQCGARELAKHATVDASRSAPSATASAARSCINMARAGADLGARGGFIASLGSTRRRLRPARSRPRCWC